MVDISLKKISASELDKNDLLSILNGLKTLKITYNDDEIIKNNIDMIRDKIINNNNIYYKWLIIYLLFLKNVFWYNTIIYKMIK